jgi:hypothetical protein
MPNTQETTAGDLAGQIITFMETGTRRTGCSPRTSSTTSPTSLGELTLCWVMPPSSPADDDRDRTHGLEGGAVGRLSASRKGRPMANSFFRRFELAEWT